MCAGELYNAADPELQAERAAAQAWLAEYNTTLGASLAARHELLRRQLGAVGSGAEIRPPFFCDYGYNIHVGDDAFLNFGCVILDVAAVHIGCGTQIGPGVQIYAADHPREPALRQQGLERGRPVCIGRNVWIGGGATLLPGISVADDAVLGAGAVVTRDVPPGATVAGNPARPIVRLDSAVSRRQKLPEP